MMDDTLLRQHLGELPYFRSILRVIEAEIMRRVDLPAPILDVGSGDGHFASVTFPRPIDVGLDPDLHSLRESRPRGAYRLHVAGWGDRMPFQDGAFASGLSNSVLEHIPGLDAVLQEVGRVLRPGAPFAVTVPNPGYRDQLQGPAWLHRIGLHRLAESYRSWFMRMSRTWNLYHEDGWEERFERAGFQIEETFRYFPVSSLHALEWGHYFGAPCVLAKKISHRWILAPTNWNLWLTERLVARYARFQVDREGTYTFYLARRKPKESG